MQPPNNLRFYLACELQAEHGPFSLAPPSLAGGQSPFSLSNASDILPVAKDSPEQHSSSIFDVNTPTTPT